MFKIITFLILMLTICGCGHKVNVQFPSQDILLITNSCPVCDIDGNPNAYKIVTDGKVFKMRYPNGCNGLLQYQSKKEVLQAINAVAGACRDSCSTHNPHMWKEIQP